MFRNWSSILRQPGAAKRVESDVTRAAGLVYRVSSAAQSSATLVSLSCSPGIFAHPCFST